MKQKIINLILIILSTIAIVGAITGSVLGCNYALILLFIPAVSLLYVATKLSKKIKFNHKHK